MSRAVRVEQEANSDKKPLAVGCRNSDLPDRLYPLPFVPRSIQPALAFASTAIRILRVLELSRRQLRSNTMIP